MGPNGNKLSVEVKINITILMTYLLRSSSTKGRVLNYLVGICLVDELRDIGVRSPKNCFP